MVAGFEDKDVLVLRFLVVEDLIDLEGHSLTGPHVGYFAEPAICQLCQPNPGVIQRCHSRADL